VCQARAAAAAAHRRVLAAGDDRSRVHVAVGRCQYNRLPWQLGTRTGPASAAVARVRPPRIRSLAALAGGTYSAAWRGRALIKRHVHHGRS